MKKEDGIVIINEVDEKEESFSFTEDALKEQGLSDQEIEKAKETGLLKEENKEEQKDDEVDEDEKEVSDEESEEDESNESEEKLLSEEDYDSFDKVHDIYQNNPDKYRELPKHIKNLYRNSKQLYKQAKIETTKRQQSDYSAIQLRGKVDKLESIVEKVRNNLQKEDVKVEDIEEILDSYNVKIEESKNEDVKGKEELSKNDIDTTKYNTLAKEVEDAGLREYSNFEELVDLAYKYAKTPGKERYQKIIINTVLDEDLDEMQKVDQIVDIAKLNPMYGENKTYKNEKIDRMEKNASKKKTSAALGSSGVRRKTYAEIEPEDIANMSLEEYKKLPPEVIKRLKAQI